MARLEVPRYLSGALLDRAPTRDSLTYPSLRIAIAFSGWTLKSSCSTTRKEVFPERG
jgi:hypothetical protein